jgi:hypothetical protein
VAVEGEEATRLGCPDGRDAKGRRRQRVALLVVRLKSQSWPNPNSIHKSSHLTETVAVRVIERTGQKPGRTAAAVLDQTVAAADAVAKKHAPFSCLGFGRGSAVD